MKSRLFIAVIAASAVIGGSIKLYAHHSFIATYSADKTIKIEGKLVQFLFRNPHSFVQVEVPDEQGVMQRWAVEWGGAGQLGGQGVTRETLRPGDIVVITGNPGRNAANHRLLMVSLQRPVDGYTWGGKAGQTFD
jgi:hypothetical protein